jgi:hypothetical protein
MITLKISFFSVPVELVVCARASGTLFIAVVISPSNDIDSSAKTRPFCLVCVSIADKYLSIGLSAEVWIYLSSEDVIQKIITLHIYERGLNLIIAENLLIKMVQLIKNPN